MAYCTADDIEEYSNMTFSATTRPTTTALADMITTHEGNINATLQKNSITIPTEGYGFAYLKLTNIYCVLSDAYGANKPGSELTESYRQLCSDRLEEINNNPAIIEPVISTGGATGTVKEPVKYKADGIQW